MELSDLTGYAREKYHIEEDFKWADFPGFSVLTHPKTGKWVALLMRQWDYETGTELQRCDIKCGKEDLPGADVPYLGNAFRMKGQKWVGVRFDKSTDPQVVCKLLDRALSMESGRGFPIVLDNTNQDSKGIYQDTLLPLRGLKGRFRDTDALIADNKLNLRYIEMMDLYDYKDNSFEGKCRNFCRQGRFMEDFEDDAPWDREFTRFFTTYHNLNFRQLRGYFAWRTRVRRGEFLPVASSLAYMYVYELLNGIGASSPEDSLLKIKAFEAGFVDAGLGDRSMKENLRRWKMEFSIVKNLPKEEVLPFISPDLLSRDRQLMVLQKPADFTDEEIFEALSALTGGKILKSPVITKHGDRGKRLFVKVWTYMGEHCTVDGWDLFSACFGKIRKYPWHPLANAIYLDDSDRKDTEYTLNECRRYVFRNGEWTEEKFDTLYFDKYRVNAVVHEADRMLRLYLKTGRKLKETAGEEWITPYVEAVIEADRAEVLEAEREAALRAAEAAKPVISIDLSGLEKIRRDARITRDSLLTEEEMRELNGEPESPALPAKGPDLELVVEDADGSEEIPFPEGASSDTMIFPSLNEVEGQILMAVMRGEGAEDLIREHHLMASVVTDAINEAMFEEIGDNVLECEGDRITLVEDYREDLAQMIEGGS